MGIMDQIANPQMADIAGALDYRQKRLDADEQKRKRIRIGQLVSEAVPNLREGSPLYQLANESPEQFAVFAKATGVPLNSGDQMQQFADDTALLYHTAQTDPYSAIETAQALKRERNESGRDTPQLDKWLQAVEEDPQTAFTGLFTTHRSINQGSADRPAGVREFEYMTEGLSEEEKEDARRVKLGLKGRASSAGSSTFRMEGADGRERVFRFNPESGDLDVYDGQSWNRAGQGDRRIFMGGEAKTTPVGEGAETGQERPSQEGGERSGMFVGRAAEEEAQAVAERTPPKDMRFNEEGRLVPIKGSPMSRKVDQQRKAARGILDRKAPGVLRDITRALEEAENAGPIAGSFATPGESAGRLGRASAAMSPAYELNQHLESIKSNISIDELQSMREASPTGGALGQVPVRQQEFLMQVQGSLLPTIPEDTLKENLRRVNNNYMKSYLDAIYGDEQEWEAAIEDGSATREEANLSLQEKADMMKKYMRETDFDEFGRRTEGEDDVEPSIDELLRMY